VQYAITVCCANRSPRFTDPSLAKIVYDTFLQVLANKGYKVLALCIMPDHLHVVMLSVEGCIAMGRAIGAAKSLSCKRAGRDVIQWQEKLRDHIVRDNEDIDNQIQYAINNPVRAGLTDDWQKWPWTYVIPGSR
jgi:putative transposase